MGRATVPRRAPSDRRRARAERAPCGAPLLRPPPPAPLSLSFICSARTRRNRAEAPAARAEAPRAATRIQNDIYYTPSLPSNPKSRHRVVWVASRPSPRRDAGDARIRRASHRDSRARAARGVSVLARRGPRGARARARLPGGRARARMGRPMGDFSNARAPAPGSNAARTRSRRRRSAGLEARGRQRGRGAGRRHTARGPARGLARGGEGRRVGWG